MCIRDRLFILPVVECRFRVMDVSELCDIAVSYTHLDVYKRQGISPEMEHDTDHTDPKDLHAYKCRVHTEQAA